MASQPYLPSLASSRTLERRFLSLYLPDWPVDFLKRVDPRLTAPLALYEKIKGGLRIAAIDREAAAGGLRLGQSVADARALIPRLTMQELDRPLLENAFAELADWHSNASPLVAIITDHTAYGDLMLDISGVSHLFGGEQAMLDMLVNRLRQRGYAVWGGIAPTLGAAWALSHFAPQKILFSDEVEAVLDDLPVAALRLDPGQISALTQMGLTRIGQLRQRARKALQARFGASLVIRLDQAFGDIQERMVPRLPVPDHYVDRRFAEPIAQLDDVLACTRSLALELCNHLENHGLGAQTFHLFLYRVDHKVMTLSLNAARLTRDPQHIASLFRHRAKRLETENYDPGFGIDLVRLAASSLDQLETAQMGAFEVETGAADIERLADRLASRLGAASVLKFNFRESHLPERAVRLVPALAASAGEGGEQLPLRRPLRLLPVPELVRINAEVPDGLPASMIWRRQTYRLTRGAGPERLGAEWWRRKERLELVAPSRPQPAEPGKVPEPLPHVPELPLHDPAAVTRDYYLVEDAQGCRYWVFRYGFHQTGVPAQWYLHGLFA